jgi:hypothetical protein
MSLGDLRMHLLSLATGTRNRSAAAATLPSDKNKAVAASSTSIGIESGRSSYGNQGRGKNSLASGREGLIRRPGLVVRLGKDMAAAAGEISAARRRARTSAPNRGSNGTGQARLKSIQMRKLRRTGSWPPRRSASRGNLGGNLACVSVGSTMNLRRTWRGGGASGSDSRDGS